MYKICVIIPYYGKWPKFFQLFLKSCSYNSKIEILLITDLLLPPDAPGNVKVIKFTFNELKQFFENKLGHSVALNSYYKLCDLKPMYGYVFREFTADYDFWGFGDIDLIYGNLIKFLTDDILNEYDVITFRTEWLSGALTLFKNTTAVNKLFMQSPEWKKVASTSRHYSFTECAKQYKQIANGVSIFDIDADITTMTAICKRGQLNGNLRYFEKKLIKESIPSTDYLFFNNGSIKDNHGAEYLLYHYITEKTKNLFSFPGWTVIPSKFFITTTGFYQADTFKFYPIIKFFRSMVALTRFVLKRNLKK